MPDIFDQAAQTGTKGDIFDQAASAAPNTVAQSQDVIRRLGSQMQETSGPGIVRSLSGALPVAGGLAGAVAGAPAFGGGAVVGGGLGAAAGEAGRQAIGKYALGDEDTLKQRLANMGIAGAVGAVSEVPAAAGIARGGQVLRGLEAAKPTKQVGDVAAGLEQAGVNLTSRGMRRGLQKAAGASSAELGAALKGSQGATNLDTVLWPARQEAMRADAANPGAFQRFNQMVADARYTSDIQGPNVTANQLKSFQSRLQRLAFEGTDPSTKILTKSLRQAYSDLGQSVRRLAPEASEPLQAATDIHAARTALAKYGGLSKTEALAVAMQQHPKTSALLSPALTTGLIAAGVEGKNILEKILKVVMPVGVP